MKASERKFIGRETPLKKIYAAIEKSGRRHLISVRGRGGVGKTYLLRKVHEEYAEQEGLLCLPIVDFSKSETRTQRWLMGFIARQAPTGFERYYEIEQAALRQDQSYSALPWSEKDLEEAFLNDCQEFEQQIRCIFLFDTLELIQDTLLLGFILRIVERTQNSVFILSGRSNQDLMDHFQQVVGSSGVIDIELAGFDEQDAMRYIEQYPAGARLGEDEKRSLYLLSEQGVPIKLALALDWLSRGLMMNTLVGHSFEELRRLSTEDTKSFQKITAAFERELVTQIGELGTYVDRAVYVMAHVHKRFNRALLRLLVRDVDTDEMLSDANIDKLVAQIELPFVKQIEEDYFVLHDEIQRMIARHIWDWMDPDHEERRRIDQKVIEYYDARIDALRSQFSENAVPPSVDWECRIYEIERLHYQLDIDLAEGYRQFSTMFEELEDRRNAELAALALDVLIKDRPLPARLRSFANTYHHGWVLVRRERLEQARECIEQGLEELTSARTIEDPVIERRAFLEREVDQRLGEVYTLLGYCHRLLGNWTDAIDYYERARESHKALIDRLQRAEEPDEELIRCSISRLAETLNNIANLQRMQGNVDIARRYCKMSLLIRERLGVRRAVGHCCYVMGMIMWESGNTSEAMNYLRQARRHYQAAGDERLERAWIDRYEGYVMFRTGNTQEAIRLLKQALDAVSNQQGLQDEHAEILLYLSRIHREEGSSEALEQALKEAKLALEIAGEVGNDYRITESYLTCCLTLVKMTSENQEGDKLPPEFDKYFREGLRVARERRYRRLEVVFAEMEGDLAFERKDYVSAFDKCTLACRRATEFKPAVFARTMSKLTQCLFDLIDEDAELVLSICDRVTHQWINAGLGENYPELTTEVDYIREVAQAMSERRALERKFKNEFRHGSWQRALEACDAADAIPICSHPHRARVHQQRADVYHGENDFSLARLYCERAARIRTTLNSDPEASGNTYLLLSRIYWKLGNTAESATYLDLAEEQYRKTESRVGSGSVNLERAYIYFRTHQFSQASKCLAEAQKVFRELGEPVLLASVLNLMSRLVRVDPRQIEYPGIGYEEAHRRGEKALQVLSDRDWFVAAEINLTLCILHYVWGLYLLKQDETEEARRHFTSSRKYNHEGWDKIEQINSPMLYSVYRGMQGNLFLLENEKERAKLHFLDELVYATQTKHMRLLRALDLLENWLISEPLEETLEDAQWFIEEWLKKGLTEKHREVEEAMKWVKEHRRYIPENA